MTNSRDYLEKRIAEIKARREANPNHPSNVLSRIINKGLGESGAKWTPETGWTDAPIESAEYSFPAATLTF